MIRTVRLSLSRGTGTTLVTAIPRPWVDDGRPEHWPKAVEVPCGMRSARPEGVFAVLDELVEQGSLSRTQADAVRGAVTAEHARRRAVERPAGDTGRRPRGRGDAEGSAGDPVAAALRVLIADRTIRPAEAATLTRSLRRRRAERARSRTGRRSGAGSAQADR